MFPLKLDQTITETRKFITEAYSAIFFILLGEFENATPTQPRIGRVRRTDSIIFE